MTIFSGLVPRFRGFFSDNKGPWGSPPSGDGSKGNGGGGEKPSGPWGSDKPAGAKGSSVTSLEEFLERNKKRFGGSGGGGGGGFVGGGFDKSIYFWGALLLLGLWLLSTTFHRIAPKEIGVVTTFGRYSTTMTPGIGWSLPAPIQRVQKVNVEEIRNVDIGSDTGETLMLTGDQNIIDIAYRVTWSIRDPEQFLFELRTPEDTIRQVAESSMRQVVAQVTLNQAIGPARGAIETRVQEEMQQTLERYESGVVIRNVSIRQLDPPAAVNEAFKDVTAAQQDAESEINKANAYSLQLRQLAEGEATAFDKVYEQYRLAPEVTKRRLYYETMERVLKNVQKTIVEVPGVTPYLPLNEMQRRRPAPEPQPQPQAGQQGRGR